MKALFVNACVRANSRTKLLCDAYIRKYWQDADVKEREVAAEPLLPGISRGRITHTPGNLPRPTKFSSARRTGTAPFPLC